MVVIRKCGIHPGSGALFKAGGDGQITIDFFTLHSFPRSSLIAEMPRDAEGGYGSDVSCYLPGCGGVVLIDNADRNVFHLPAAEDGSHEEQAEQGQHEAYTEVEPAGGHTLPFTAKYII